ncbi:bacteriochlorophyll 4-vinyl reductase [Roseobacter denitrificans]|uniref:Bacteriochlorophyll 4-vinyl reductase, putative n=1 Tax=Roseobacter denitrificans (strain ATCC 33942 / OCh 114) TaxID=375451 RepID=Q164H1_ROSDO|nr:bacteriochlorophyll 4-vinyl reductase [Roseobacter denitrificans]ABG32622.1 bacteriochlorophyll 4-vinyl reductase, putative [Roseobacter denitrificans OCh 114]AVL52062.1 bacteriochlorophyll 4-vinyl reductase [Roseobacter denitrificans]SFF92900.1 divinyl protochlorophyllide a 8-vinyl-reductase [Roseobacter denitrificans OCh 114]
MADTSASEPLTKSPRIGPNAILQLEEPLDRMLGQGALAQILKISRVAMPSGQEMVPQEDVGQVHHTMWRLFPQQAEILSEHAGAGTARYIAANRIPKAARVLLRVLPRGLAERLLTKAISDHAWTFCGSGVLDTRREGGEIHFMLRENPLADKLTQPPHRCIWHAAVFAELFSLVLGRAYFCKEISCCALGADLCHFVVSRTRPTGHFKGLQL